MKSMLKTLTIILGAFLSLILTRMGISYLVVLIALGLIMPYITNDKKSPIISGVLYATLSYIISYPSGLFLSNFMPDIEIPIYVSSAEVMINLIIGLLVPVIVSIIICSITSIIGTYISNILKNYQEKDEKHSFNKEHEFEVEESRDDSEELSYDRQKKLLNLNSIQKSKNRRKYE